MRRHRYPDQQCGDIQAGRLDRLRRNALDAVRSNKTRAAMIAKKRGDPGVVNQQFDAIREELEQADVGHAVL